LPVPGHPHCEQRMDISLDMACFSRLGVRLFQFIPYLIAERASE